MTCEVCHDGASKAEGFCLQCEAFICVACIDLHKGLKEYDGHKVLSMKELLQKGLSQVTVKKSAAPHCDVHKEPLKLYCFTCRSLICPDCIVKDHKDHEYEFMASVATNAREKIAESVQPLKEAEAVLQKTSKGIKAAIGEVKHQGDAVTSSTTAYFKDLHRILDAREQEIMDETVRIVQEKVSKLTQQEEAVLEAAGEVAGLAGNANQCVMRCSDSEIVSMHEELLSQIEQKAEKLNASERIELVEELDIRVQLESAEFLQQLCQTKTKVAPVVVDATKCEVVFDKPGTIEVGKPQEVILVTKLANGRLTKSTSKVFCHLKCLHTDICNL